MLTVSQWGHLMGALCELEQKLVIGWPQYLCLLYQDIYIKVGHKNVKHVHEAEAMNHMRCVNGCRD